MPMRTPCDVCESAAAVLFCAADEASLCRSCYDKVHLCNKLASRHVRCEVDGSSLCLQCDMAVHVGGKRMHRRYLLFRQRVEFPGDKVGLAEDLTLQLMGQAENKTEQHKLPKPTLEENQINHSTSPVPISNTSARELGKSGPNMIDLNMKPHKIHDEASNHQEP